MIVSDVFLGAFCGWFSLLRASGFFWVEMHLKTGMKKPFEVDHFEWLKWAADPQH